ncbi:G-protein alpha subunit-domain-containing protein [Boletus reticuloceps]|uniref:G-protein alpha subunit-domain-containing protein n=1 Tax=Boletus reticuloceps TaxID=495285 RepID=A0A8I3A5J0_9AGAM|nr:G-protein alpha subunit-domain-containing protein [Boletus reticuloceps]
MSFLKSYMIPSFLDNAERLAARDYEPTDDDIVRAHSHTQDIQEYEMDVVEGGELQTWKIYNVGGSLTQHNVWLSFLDTVDVVIFVAPISCFDEQSREDPMVNQLEDSFTIWKAVCSSKLLAWVPFILFLNKIGILEHKIASGVMVNQYVPSYGDRPNYIQSVVKCTCTTSHFTFVGYYVTLGLWGLITLCGAVFIARRQSLSVFPSPFFPTQFTDSSLVRAFQDTPTIAQISLLCMWTCLLLLPSASLIRIGLACNSTSSEPTYEETV